MAGFPQTSLLGRVADFVEIICLTFEGFWRIRPFEVDVFHSVEMLIVLSSVWTRHFWMLPVRQMLDIVTFEKNAVV